ncbi:hypothetical protein JTB14_014222 [Gonioctena quinquepunctata]|nr:hypothetical protein JTB14_014222 [Gonioctena quinquepunctata]
MAIRLEDCGDSEHYPSYQFFIEGDVEVVVAESGEISPIVKDLSDTTGCSRFLKYQSKLTHVLNRIDNIGEERSERPALRTKAPTLPDRLHRKVELDWKESNQRLLEPRYSLRYWRAFLRRQSIRHKDRPVFHLIFLMPLPIIESLFYHMGGTLKSLVLKEIHQWVHFSSELRNFKLHVMFPQKLGLNRA